MTTEHLVFILDDPHRPWEVVHTEDSIETMAPFFGAHMAHSLHGASPEEMVRPAFLSLYINGLGVVTIHWLPGYGAPNAQAERFISAILNIDISLSGPVVLCGLSEDMVVRGLQNFAVTGS